MIGNIYGLDIKLSPDGKYELPVGIEINGVDSGTDFFRYEEGFNYYKNFARVLGAETKGKPIFIQDLPQQNHDSIEKIVSKIELQRKNNLARKNCEKLTGIFGDRFDFHYEWLDDLLQFNLEKLEETYFDSEYGCYVKAALEERVPLYVFTELSFKKNFFEFTLIDDKKMRISPKDIGAIRSRSSTLFRVPKNYQHLFLNNSLIEGILDNKPLTNFLNYLFSDNLPYIMAPSLPFGFGVNNKKLLLNFIKKAPSDYIVRKRGGSYCGTGVEILEKKELLSKIKSTKSNKINPTMIQALLMQVVMETSKGWRYEELVSMYESFIDSIPILHPHTKKNHDGCARTMIYSPLDGDPIVLGSQWRLSTNPIDDTTSSLEDRFRANLSRGALAVPIDSSYESLINKFAVKIVKEFEKAIVSYKDTILPHKSFIWKHIPNASEFDMYRFIFWGYHSGLIGKEFGMIDRKNKFITLPGLKKEREKLAKKIVEEKQDLDSRLII